MLLTSLPCLLSAKVCQALLCPLFLPSGGTHWFVLLAVKHSSSFGMGWSPLPATQQVSVPLLLQDTGQEVRAVAQDVGDADPTASPLDGN